ncbi:hypothetical protein BDN71DRAFT_1511698 [Pleurotus eryngii]|uniref:Uncharacterized protein n=1 Tax=Pleurotus eryngii TaxID=5323 RepID=A0A9P6DAQ7_PLEER|nr:hypothetical protein BDN71DRAFT_1511698 [Pleurotus eryngii]
MTTLFVKGTNDTLIIRAKEQMDVQQKLFVQDVDEEFQSDILKPTNIARGAPLAFLKGIHEEI